MEEALSIRRVARGRPLYVEPDGTLWLGRRFTILRSRDEGQTWSPTTRMPSSIARQLVAPSRLASRLLRNEVRALLRLSDGTLVAANRQGVFRASPDQPVMDPCRTAEDDLRLMPPMCLSRGPGDRVIWGEYGSPRRPREVRLYVSDDRAHHFEVVHVFPPGEVLHVHNVVWDPSGSHYWVLAGDHDEEPGIGCLSADLKHFEWIGKGQQSYRAVEVFDFGDSLVYATDTEVARNALVRLDKATGRVERLRDFDGSCIYACRFGGLYALTTTVEPSAVNATREAKLWISRDGERWECVYRARKDRWSARYFQFGSLVLPRGRSDREQVFFGGQAVSGIDGRAILAETDEGTGPARISGAPASTSGARTGAAGDALAACRGRSG